MTATDDDTGRATIHISPAARDKLRAIRYKMTVSGHEVPTYNVVIERLHAMYMRQGDKHKGGDGDE